MINFELEINGKKEKISMEDAKKLYDELHLLFGQNNVPYLPQVPYYTEPFWRRDRTAPYYPDFPIITCNTENN